MDPEIVKTVTELAKATETAAGLSIPFTAIVKRMLGPAADELAEMWRDQVRVYRHERQVKLLEKVEKIAKDGNLTLGPVPPKILFPLLEGASFEDDDSLHDMWAALLANAASPDSPEAVRAGFIAILKKMALDEAVLLKYWYQMKLNNDREVEDSVFTQLKRDETGFAICVDSLEADKLISRRYYDPRSDFDKSSFGRTYMKSTIMVTGLGAAFIEACRPPNPKS